MSAKSRWASLRAAVFALVDLMPFRFLCMWPLAVPVDGGRFFSSDRIRPGKESNLV